MEELGEVVSCDGFAVVDAELGGGDFGYGVVGDGCCGVDNGLDGSVLVAGLGEKGCESGAVGDIDGGECGGYAAGVKFLL
ncbi:hypothetical protein LAUMK191_05697 [Mycobacterium attenuatum]|uniref:Uncharacterized protein n=1 Tax=Mycobacterium attenuatum TaxID=2341086 RepID=A0A498QJ56_9MYCO|nr:hypothetical protein LAUMK136_05670 [Mycobacterium attenuatum]VBA60895.1 hypothetical protein LAUMK191_05697 [Mycobacterium attenuatum]VBA62501.1 hypothetical protein LAUMK41_05892 [Mycobacterium attenuatum]